MGRLLLICRIVMRDLRRRPAEAVLLLLAITAATTTLTLGLALSGVTDQPYQQTREATSGPDIVAGLWPTGSSPRPTTGLAALTALADDPHVTARSGPYPTTWAVMTANSLSAGAQIEGRDVTTAPVDQPKLTAGRWLRDGGNAVVEQSFADVLGIKVGDSITLHGRPFEVVGIAVTAAISPYPQACDDGCEANLTRQQETRTGLVWVTRAAARNLATSADPLYYLMNLKLAHPADIQAIVVNPHAAQNPAYTIGFDSWQNIGRQDGLIVANEQQAMVIGAWMLALLAVAGVAVLVGGRLAAQTRRVGLLKAVGATPGTVTLVLLAEYILLALAAAAAGLALGRLLTPLLADPGSGLIGTAGAPTMTLSTMAIVAGVAVTVAAAASLLPSLRAARTSTLSALIDAARPPRRKPRLIALSRRLPVSLSLALRLSSRRPRRSLLAGASVGITVATLVTVMTAHTRLAFQDGGNDGLSALSNPRIDRLDQVMLVITVVLVTLAVINAVFITWATALDARRSLAVARALGATPLQVALGLAASQMLPALPGAILGIPAGMGLSAALRHGAAPPNYPSIWWLATAALATVLVTAVLTAIPARIGARRPVAEILQAELA